MAYIFTTLDGTDGNGIRAEVRVEAGDGKITSIDEDKEKSAQIFITAEGLKLPVKGWVGKNTELYHAARKAFENGTRISYRIEVQRKPSIDRSLSITEVRGEDDAKKARDNSIRIFAGMRILEGDNANTYYESVEAVTNPDEDPKYEGGRHKAAATTKQNPTPVQNNGTENIFNTETLLEALEKASQANVANEILTNIVSLAIAFGADPEKVFALAGGKDRTPHNEEQPPLRTSFSTEAPLWQRYNSDGRLNLGASRYAAGTGAETFVRENLQKGNVNTPELETAIKYFASIILSIADRVQVKAYGDGFHADRGASSHARIRGVVYDTIKNYHNIPTPETTNPNNITTRINEWIAEVGNTAYNRYITSVQISDDATNFKLDIPEAWYKNGNTTTDSHTEYHKTVTKEETVSPETVETVTKPDIETNNITENSQKAVHTNPENIIIGEIRETETNNTTEKPVETTKTETVVEPEPTNNTEQPNNQEELQIFEPFMVADLPEDEEPSTEETINKFKELISETKIEKNELPLVSNLLNYTFGVKKAQEVPNELLQDFTDFYFTAGTENLIKVIKANLK